MINSIRPTEIVIIIYHNKSYSTVNSSCGVYLIVDFHLQLKNNRIINQIYFT